MIKHVNGDGSFWMRTLKMITYPNEDILVHHHVLDGYFRLHDGLLFYISSFSFLFYDD